MIISWSLFPISIYTGFEIRVPFKFICSTAHITPLTIRSHFTGHVFDTIIPCLTTITPSFKARPSFRLKLNTIRIKSGYNKDTIRIQSGYNQDNVVYKPEIDDTIWAPAANHFVPVKSEKKKKYLVMKVFTVVCQKV